MIFITRFLNFFRMLLGRLIPYRILHRDTLSYLQASQAEFDYVPKGQYQYLPKGDYVYGLASQYLLVRKNRYRAVLLPGQEPKSDFGIGWLTEDNTPESYDSLWGDEKAVSQFRAESDHVRERLTEEIVDQIIERIDENALVVDVGCGVGDLLIEIQKKRPDVKISGCDFSIRAIDSVSQRIPGGEFLQYLIKTDLPYSDNSFDVVMGTDFLEHLEYPDLIVSEMVRICRAGGIVVLVVPDGDVDQFLGHLWFWNQESFSMFLSKWNTTVQRLPKTREFLAIIEAPSE